MYEIFVYEKRKRNVNKYLIIQHVVKVLFLKKKCRIIIIKKDIKNIKKGEKKSFFRKHKIRNEISFEGNFPKICNNVKCCNKEQDREN